MKKSGLFNDSDRGYYDRFYSRLIFPINDVHSNVIAFAGRSLDKNNQAKYINSIETPIYNKSKVFYGLDLTKKNILSEKYAILVEGYFDLMRLYQHGITNALAISGCSILIIGNKDIALFDRSKNMLLLTHRSHNCFSIKVLLSFSVF